MTNNYCKLRSTNCLTRGELKIITLNDNLNFCPKRTVDLKYFFPGGFMKLSFYLFLSFFLLAFASILAQSGNIYVGAESCGMCHKSEKQGSQLSISQNSAHSKAFETLKTDTANQIEKE